MANSETLIPIPGRLHSVATEGHVAGADEIYDDDKRKKQSAINQESEERIKNLEDVVGIDEPTGESLSRRVTELEEEVGDGGSVDARISAAKSELRGNATSSCDTLGEAEALIHAESARAQAAEADRYTKSDTYNKQEVNGLVDTPHQEYVTVEAYEDLPELGSMDTIYRVANYDGSQSQEADDVYSEYAWNGTQYVFLCVKSQIGEVFDISVYNNNATYDDLAAALAGDNVPQSIQKGGMSVKYVQSSDNKYVQYRLMTDGWSTYTEDWSLSENNVLIEHHEYILAYVDKEHRFIAGVKSDGSIEWAYGVPTPVKEFVEVFVKEYTSKFENIPLQTEENYKDYLEMTIDPEQKIVSYRSKDSTLHEYAVDIENLNVGDVYYKNGIPQQIKDYVDSHQPAQEAIPYNDMTSVGSKVLKIYNPYKERKQHQYTGQLHCHTWTKFSGHPGKFPYGYSIEYTESLTAEERQALLEQVASEFAKTHKDLGFDFMALTNYAQFGDVTHEPAVMPANFLWLCDSYETTTETLGVYQHMIVHCAPNFSVPYGTGTFKEVMDRVQDYGCISQWPHPTDSETYATSDVIATVKSRLRLMEVWDGISMRKYDAQGNMTNREVVVAGVMSDAPYDDLITQGNFAFCMAISDERPAMGNTGTAMTTPNVPKNIKNGCIKVFADNLTSEDIFNSLLTGNFYASSDSDVNINSVTIADGRYTVDVGIEGVVVEFLKEDNTIVKTVTTSAGSTVAYYDITGNEQFVRARIYKLNNLPYNADYWYYNKEWIVWTQPVFISKIIL